MLLQDTRGPVWAQRCLQDSCSSAVQVQAVLVGHV
jgi:hypothetical protein